jgi:WD40 repeat protein
MKRPASQDGTIQLLDAATGQPVGELLLGHTVWVHSISFSLDETCIATYSVDQPETVRLWDVGTGQLLGESFPFSPNGTHIATCSTTDETIRLWDTTTGQPVGEPLLGHTKRVCSISFSPDGTCIISGSGDTTVRLWDVGTGQPVGEPFVGHTDWIRLVSFSRDGTHIVSCSCRMGLISCLIPTIRQFRCGMQRQGSQSVSLYRAHQLPLTMSTLEPASASPIPNGITDPNALLFQYALQT